MNLSPAPSPTHPVFCTYCFEHTSTIRLTKKGLPTLYCRHCGTRVFFSSSIAVRGFFLIAPSAINLYRQMSGTEPVDIAEMYDGLKETYGAITDRALATK